MKGFIESWPKSMIQASKAPAARLVRSKASASWFKARMRSSSSSRSFQEVYKSWTHSRRSGQTSRLIFMEGDWWTWPVTTWTKAWVRVLKSLNLRIKVSVTASSRVRRGIGLSHIKKKVRPLITKQQGASYRCRRRTIKRMREGGNSTSGTS